MPTFEERYTAWIDGQLRGEELVAFERELDARGRAEAEADRADALRLRTLLQRHAAPPMPRADDFNEALLRRLREDARPAAVAVSEAPASETFWTRQKLAWAAAIALLLSLAFLRAPQRQPGAEASLRNLDGRQGMAEIITAATYDDGLSVTPIRSEENGVTVLWVDGLDYLPASYQLQ